MTVNLKKTTCQFFTLNRQPFSPQLVYNDMPVQQSDVSMYLGCALDNKLKWTKHAELVLSKARKRLFILKRLTGVKWGCNRDTLNTTYKTYIQPFLNYCNEVLISASENTQKGFIQCVRENIQYKIINDVPFELLSFANPLDYAILDIRLDLVLNVRKRDLSPTALHAIALETINTRFPPEEWLHIYTDGSLLDFAQGAGIGVFSHLFSFYLHAGPLTTHFDDSTSALQALSNYNENNCLRVQNCRELLGKIKGKIVFQWVPSHCGLWGNERTDFLAKKGTGILQNFRRDLTLHSAKLEIKMIFRESFCLTASRVARDKPWSTLCKKSHGIPSSPRAAAVAKFRLLTGHDSLCAHLFRFNLVTSPICVLCDTGQDMTAAHLDECSALNDLNCIVKRYWRVRCLTDATLGSIPIRRFCVQKTCSRPRPRATTPAEDRFLALSARRRRTTTVPQLVADHFQASGRRISATTLRNHRLHNAGLYARRPVVCVPLNGRQRRNRLCWAREHVSWTQQQWASVLFTDESRFTMESDSGRPLIWREQRTRYHQSNTVERHSYRGGGILVWAGISLGGHTDLHVFHGGTVTGLRYRDETLDPYVRPYAAAIGNDFILMDDNARPHRARIVEEYLEDHGLERMEWPARSPDLNLIEHLWDYLGREVAALNPPPRSLHELKQGLLCVWSSLPIPVSDNLINSMGNRCRQCIQVRGGHIPY
ncbi:transposable element Tcb2 transposase [Trichonephila clavipes]|uniref:Transposable element Tcb2 transposase n=1 Tax=Trichonephila clavipes TaxID=2585209 RepID=A0A8X6SAV9_TRICX|nr:transposable element Tcb2 transposase [Trichonephila clavipes]